MSVDYMLLVYVLMILVGLQESFFEREVHTTLMTEGKSSKF
jgi:hypothetical protein